MQLIIYAFYELFVILSESNISKKSRIHWDSWFFKIFSIPAIVFSLY